MDTDFSSALGGRQGFPAPALRRGAGTGSPGKTGPGGSRVPTPGDSQAKYSLGTKWQVGNKEEKVGNKEKVGSALLTQRHGIAALPDKGERFFLIHHFQQKPLTWGHLGEGCLG